jgi:predicted alpha/beta-fold hydrolase
MTNDIFSPLPLLGNPHVQTIIGSLMHRSAFRFAYRERHVLLPDGDRLLVYDSVPRRWRGGDAMVLLVHGLTGSHQSGYLIRLAEQLLPAGYRVVRMDLRAAGRGIRWARGAYNAACSADVRVVVEAMRKWSAASPVVLVGFSLGGNVVLKLAGEAAGEPLANLAAVAAVNAPIDLHACATLLGEPQNQLYDRYFARTLVKHVRRQRSFFPDLPKVHFPAELTLRQFDELFTAPRGGFADAEDYYHRAGALPLIEKIEVPALLFTSRDDPFIFVRTFEELPARANLSVRIVERGGHLGYLGFSRDGGIRWAEPQVARWIRETVPARK